MKVIAGNEIASTGLHSSTLSAEYENQCKQMWTFLEVFVCGEKCKPMFSAR